ncbi:MAG: transporter substrate-binding domain-containing protein [Oscillospiraceae bacterium]|nr:transporter substrate-binding domain-containing protein [Oscillospiraceae bacterium]
MTIGIKVKRSFCLVFVLLMMLTLISGCANEHDGSDANQVGGTPSSFRDVQDITADEIASIEALQRERANTPFIYGMTLMTESFIKENGEMGGYADLLCRFLTDFFGIPFKLELVLFEELMEGLLSGAIDFSGTIMPTPEREKYFFMTDTIAERQYSMIRLAGSPALSQIAQERPVRYAFVAGTPHEAAVSKVIDPSSYEPVWINDSLEVHELLINGYADAYVTVHTTEALFMDYDDLIIEDFTPLIFNPVSIATANEQLEPIISVIKKAQQSGALMPHLSYLYDKGYQDFRLHKMSVWLTDEEEAYINDNPVIPIAAFNSNYPLSFFHPRHSEWQGVYFDLLDEVAKLTGLQFNVVHNEFTQWPAMQEMLIKGEIFIVPELTWTKEREGLFLWSETKILDDYFALVSRADYPDITVNDIQHLTVGVARGTTFTAMFERWFPNHRNTVEYEGIDLAFAALREGEVDMVMTTQRRLMHLTHLQELVGYKANLIFSQPIESRFGYNVEHEHLRSIIDKALTLSDTSGIADAWMRKTYDYRAKLAESEAEAQQPWLISSGVLTVLAIILLIVIFIRNSNEEKRLEKLVIERTAEARSASKAKSRFLANMSHEIRSPMNSIIGFAELAQDAENPQRTQNYLRNIQSSAEWLLSIINDILDISKIEADKLELEHIAFDLSDVFETCRSTIAPLIEEKGIALYCHAEPSVGKKLLGDPNRLRQALINLLSNAIKFTNVGTVSLGASIKEHTENTVTVGFEIKDTGIGMNPEQVRRIFDSFTQGDDSIARKFGGTGLGLTITKNIIELMNSRLIVESTVGVGSKFSFDIIFDTIADDDIVMSEQEMFVNDFERPNFKGEILVCEDNRLNQQVICDHLERVGIKNVVANNGYESVSIIKGRLLRKEKMFDLIFMDIHMPVMDGLEAVSEIKKLGVETPIIALTANIMSDDLESYENSGMPDCLGKPFSSQELWRCLAKYLPVVGYSAIDKQQQIIIDENTLKVLQVYFVKNNQTTFADVKKAIADDDAKLAHRLVHTLKSNAGQIGEKTLQTTAAGVEDMLSGGAIAVTDEQLELLEEELTKVLDKLTPMLSAVETKAKPGSIDTDKALEILDKLEPLLASHSTECMEMLDEVLMIEGAQELVRQIEDINYKAAMDELTKLRDTLS